MQLSSVRKLLFPIVLPVLALYIFLGGVLIPNPVAADPSPNHSPANNPLQPTEAITLTLLGTYTNITATFGEGASEIVSYDPVSQTLYVVNGFAAAIDILDISDPTLPTLLGQIDVTPYGANVNSVAVQNGVVAAAVEADPLQNPGKLVFFDRAGNYLNDLTIGALPDMVTFSPDGQTVLVANEGEPNSDYDNDPEGSVTLVDISGGVGSATITNIGFTDFNVGGPRHGELPTAVRIYGPNATVAQDIEPEYIAVSPDSSTAYVTLQENNALAIIDIDTAYITAIVALGFKNHELGGAGLDASDRDNIINIANWPVYGMYQPDSIAAYEQGGNLYLVTSNEGDTRDYDAYGEESRVSGLDLDPGVFTDAATLQLPENLGRLTVTTANGDTDGDDDFDALYVPGARSFSIWSATGQLVYDSGDALEQITATVYPDDFNSNNDENNSFDNRSDNKGPEPEALALGRIYDRVYAFVGLERMGGIMVFDVTDPMAPEFVQYVNNRDFAGDPEAGTAGDLGPEGLYYIQGNVSPNGAPILAVANEISGSTTLYGVQVPAPTDVNLTAFTGMQVLDGMMVLAAGVGLLGLLGLWRILRPRR
ncbi:MAG: choice-of-anchor I family protein [Chloroflexi bacterium]|nr:choice-of-anchor I family protein [Chloroflexota bacterium]MBP8058112.1 choice-of-anchor I family protein [Chloroflexota bacterium]